MFESRPLPEPMPSKEYKAAVLELRQRLLEAQHALRKTQRRVIVVMAGPDGGGKTAAVNRLNEWMDPRWITTRAYESPSDEEAERPPQWRYWMSLPPRGRIACFLSSWYSRPLLRRVYGGRRKSWERTLEEIREFEAMLAADGAVILKFWMHLDVEAQRQRMRSLEADPLRSWRVTRREWFNVNAYDRFIDGARTAIERTSSDAAPWHVVDGRDPRGRELHVAREVLAAMRQAAYDPAPQSGQPRSRRIRVRSAARRSAPTLTGITMLPPLPKRTYSDGLEREQHRFGHLQRRLAELGGSLVLVFEGVDAAGKGGIIRRLIAPLDARSRAVVPIAAPTDEELAQHYLWRFWRQIPRAGKVTIFDRSWYGRVLVERVEGFAPEADWRRAYGEICSFERQLTRHGVLLLKFWVQVSREEQLRRFEDRAATAHKRWKLTDEDWRNREKWDAYSAAASEMFSATHRKSAPWLVIGGDDKLAARVAVLRAVNDRLEAAVDNAQVWTSVGPTDDDVLDDPAR